VGFATSHLVEQMVFFVVFLKIELPLIISTLLKFYKYKNNPLSCKRLPRKTLRHCAFALIPF
jgi:hypothetical protein